MSQNQPAKDAFVESAWVTMLATLAILVRDRAYGNVVVDLRVDGGKITMADVTHRTQMKNLSVARGQ